MVDYAVASIKTGVEGAEAGVIVAPLSLMGRDTGSSTWTVTAATLKENKTRLSTAYAYEPTWTLLFLKDIGLKSCEFTDKVQDKLKQSLIEREPAFREVCEVLVAALEAPPPEEDDQRALGGWHTARKACGFESLGAKEQVPTLRVAVDNFRRQLARARNRFAATDMRRAEFERRATAVHDSLEVLNSFAMPFPDSCIKDKAIDAAVLRTAWERRRYRIGVALVYDTFPLQFGFNPSKAPGDEPLPKWEYSSAGVRADVEMHEQAFDCRLGLGVARERGALGDKIVTNLSGIFSASTLLMVVGGGSILQEDGTTAPYLTGGLRIAAKLAPSPPPTQAKLVSEAEAAVFFDFRVNESLTIRFDIPVKAKLVPDKPEDSRTGKRDLQGAIPLAITAALKL
ncbi:hypothetical protein MFUL124B02_36100 [Myxococcus fulvus 124B02]|nr:hypothetical protein MFUL124B02_36100 [Myxococcus fulvus 124B02]